MKRLINKIPLELLLPIMLALPGLIVILGIYLIGTLALEVAVMATGAGK